VRLAFIAVVVGALWSAGAAFAQCTVSGESCGDGRYCTVNDRCNASLVCVSGPARDCSDGDPCTTDTCNESADRCDHSPAPSGTFCNDGEFCTNPDECDGAGNCIAGPPRTCDDDRECTADSCDELGDTCINDLDDGACVIRGDCYEEGDVDPRTMDPCDQCVPSVQTNRFVQAPNGTPCGISACSSGVYTSAPFCDTTGACVPGMTSPCESGTCADVTSCVGCLVDGDCGAGEFCSGTGCAAVLADGESCPRDAACINGECADGVCCSTPCDGPCQSCGESGMAGTCIVHAAGTDPEGGCSALGCDGSGACIPDPTVDGSTPDSGAGVDSATGSDTSISGDGGDNSLTAHGSGCVACAVGAPGRGGNRALAVLAGLVGLAAFRRRRRR
jgi:MYXO-CTERM domain-containing protein